MHILLCSLVICLIDSFQITNTSGTNQLRILVNESLDTTLTDNEYSTYRVLHPGDSIRITAKSSFRHLYIIYYNKTATGQLKFKSRLVQLGENSFLHEFISLNTSIRRCSLQYQDTVSISLIYSFGKVVPDWVQRWERPVAPVDLLLIPAHADDEQLFFAGLLPTVIDQHKKPVVLYLISHPDAPYRMNEQLNGLWRVGVRSYPILGIVPDMYSESLQDALKDLQSRNISFQSILNHLISAIRQFQPTIIVTHDANGEYGHGQHRLTAHAVVKAVELAENPAILTVLPAFKPCKLILHLYPNRAFKMDYDIPLSSFQGLTAYEVAKLGFQEHQSQRHLRYTPWLEGRNRSYRSAQEIHPHSPLEFGVYSSITNIAQSETQLFGGCPVGVKTGRSLFFKSMLLIMGMLYCVLPGRFLGQKINGNL